MTVKQPCQYFLIDVGVELFSPHRKYLIDELLRRGDHVVNHRITNASPQEQARLRDALTKVNPDVILVDPWLVLSERRDASFKYMNIISGSDLSGTCQICCEILDTFPEAIKVVMGGWLDVHSMTELECEKLWTLFDEKNYYLWGLSGDSYYYNNELVVASTARAPTLCYKSFLSNPSVKEKIIPYLHSCPVNTQFWKPSSGHAESYEFDFHVPGSRGPVYPLRTDVWKKMFDSSSSDYRRLTGLLKALMQVYLKNKDSPALINYLYYDLIKKSKMCFCDGGLMNYVTCKFLEVPALDSLVVAPRLATLDEYGFKGGVHYLEYDSSVDYSRLQFENLQLQTLVELKRNAREIIRQKHATTTRVDQLMEVVNKISLGIYSGASYVAGDLVFA